MADAQNRLFSINAAADALGKDRRTIDRTLVGVAPDGFEGKAPRWRLASIVKALKARSGSAGSEDAEVIGEIERLDQALREGFERLEAEPDLAKRREMAKEIGPYIGALDSAFERANATRSDGERPLLERHRDFMMGQLIGSFLALAGWELATPARSGE